MYFTVFFVYALAWDDKFYLIRIQAA